MVAAPLPKVETKNARAADQRVSPNGDSFKALGLRRQCKNLADILECEQQILIAIDEVPSGEAAEGEACIQKGILEINVETGQPARFVRVGSGLDPTKNAPDPTIGETPTKLGLARPLRAIVRNNFWSGNRKGRAPTVSASSPPRSRLEVRPWLLVRRTRDY